MQHLILSHFPIRKTCPPGACVCQRARLLDDADADQRILMLTLEQEQRLIERIGKITTYDDLKHVASLLQTQLGLILHILPSAHEVRTIRGFTIELEERPGLCKKTRQTVRTAIRKCLENHPEIAFAILNAHDLLSNANA